MDKFSDFCHFCSVFSHPGCCTPHPWYRCGRDLDLWGGLPILGIDLSRACSSVSFLGGLGLLLPTLPFGHFSIAVTSQGLVDVPLGSSGSKTQILGAPISSCNPNPNPNLLFFLEFCLKAKDRVPELILFISLYYCLSSKNI